VEKIIEIANEVSREKVRGASWSAEAMAKAVYELGKAKVVSCNDVNEIAKIIVNANPAMGSLYNLSLILKNSCNSKKDLYLAAQKFLEYINLSRNSIIRYSNKLFSENVSVFTLSNSSNVYNVIKENKNKINKVLVAESYPGGEGAIFATQIKGLGVNVELYPDASISNAIEKSNFVLIGADTITIDGCLFNKVGTKNASIIANYYGKPVIAVFEPFKINPAMRCDQDITIARSYLIQGYGELSYKLFDHLPNNLLDGILSVDGLIDPSGSNLSRLHESFLNWFTNI